jgi:predicted lipoprotein
MAESNAPDTRGVGALTTPVPVVASGKWLLVPAAIVILAVGYFFPPFHVVRIEAAGGGATATVAGFDPGVSAAQFLSQKLPATTSRATAAATLLPALQSDPAAAAKRFAHQVGIGGTAYYFVRGSGRVATVDTNQVIMEIEGASSATIALRLGPLFGNTVRDATGLLNVNDFPGLAEFNALAAELNRRVETDIFPRVRELAKVGQRLAFVGCAEAPETVGPGPVLSLVPVAVSVASP